MFWPGPAEQKQLGRRSDSTHKRDSQSQALQAPLAGAIVSPRSGKFTKSGWNWLFLEECSWWGGGNKCVLLIGVCYIQAYFSIS